MYLDSQLDRAGVGHCVVAAKTTAQVNEEVRNRIPL